MKSRIVRFVGIAVAAVSGVTLACIALGVFTGYILRPERWEIPAGYQGWIVVRYDDPACPPATTDGLYRVLRVSTAGRVCTSSSPGKPLSIQYSKYVYVSRNGAQASLPEGDWNRSGIQAWEIGYDPVAHVEWIYIGTVKQVKSSGPEPPFSSTPTP